MAARRGEQEVRQFGAAMLHQLELNKKKGPWDQQKLEEDQLVTKGDLVWDVFYHLIKLGLAVRPGLDIDPIRIQEYAADVGNCSMFVADFLGSLDSTYAGATHQVTQEDDFEVLHEFSLDLIKLLKKYLILPKEWEDGQHSKGGR